MTAVLNLEIQVVPCEADGSHCIGCADAVYMNARCIHIKLVGSQNTTCLPDSTLCSSCAEILRESMDAK